jgi:hypothetical protein
VASENLLRLVERQQVASDESRIEAPWSHRPKLPSARRLSSSRSILRSTGRKSQ